MAINLNLTYITVGNVIIMLVQHYDSVHSDQTLCIHYFNQCNMTHSTGIATDYLYNLYWFMITTSHVYMCMTAMHSLWKQRLLQQQNMYTANVKVAKAERLCL